MPASKQQMIRIMHLVSMMKENRYPNHPKLIAAMRRLDIAGAYAVSQKTVQRDIEYLKSEYDAPIRYDSAMKGYYLTNPGWTLDVPMLSDKEMQAVVIGARLAESLMPPPIGGEIRQAANTLIVANETGMDETACLISLVATGSRVPVNPDIFKQVFNAWQSLHGLEIRYRKGTTGIVAEYLLEPQVLVFHDGLWYLKSIILKSNGLLNPEHTVRTLALHRIESAVIHPGTFQPNQKLISEVNAGEVHNFPTIAEAKLRFSGNAVPFARENYPAETITDEQDGSLTVTVQNAIEFKLINLVLNENGAVQIISPPELVAQVIAQAKNVISLQEKFL